MNDREAFAETIRRYKRKGKADLLSTGIVIDTALVKELREPGSDQRHGVNFVCRPNDEIVERATTIQQRLAEYEPDQYYYPPEDLHLTLVEICHSRTREDADRIVMKARRLSLELFERPPRVELDEPTLAYDRWGAALNFLPCGGQLQLLRSSVRQDLARNGVPVESRYLSTSAHITLLRYTAPLKTPAAEWVRILDDCDVRLGSPWLLSPILLTWGATWYGMQGRISNCGPVSSGGGTS
jgi:2'-5' RNA ligase